MPPKKPDGVWVTHYDAGESFTVFSSEIAALRDAVDTGKQVTRLPYGVPLSDQLNLLRTTTQKGTSE